MDREYSTVTGPLMFVCCILWCSLFFVCSPLDDTHLAGFSGDVVAIGVPIILNQTAVNNKAYVFAENTTDGSWTEFGPVLEYVQDPTDIFERDKLKYTNFTGTFNGDSLADDFGWCKLCANTWCCVFHSFSFNPIPFMESANQSLCFLHDVM